MILNSPRLTIEVILGEEKYSLHCDVVAIFHDIASNVYNPGVQAVNTSGTSAVTAVDSPVTGQTRVIKRITVVNMDTIDHTIYIRLNNTVTGKLYVFALDTLLPGRDLVYTG